MADYLPKFAPGDAVTFTASAAVVGGRAVEVSGDRTVAPGTAASTKAIGIAARDAAINERVVVYLFTGAVHRAPAAAAVVAGAHVESAAAGKVQTRTTGTDIGVALTAATDADDIIEFVKI